MEKQLYLEDPLLVKVNRTVSYCRLHVEHYRRSFRKLAIDEGIGSWEQFDSLPFTTKTDIQRSYPFGFLGVALSEVVAYHESSGTADGDVNRSSRTAAFSTKADVDRDLKRRTSGALTFLPSDVVMNALPYAYTSSGIQFHNAAQQAGAMVIAADNGSTLSPFRRQLDLMRRLNPTVLVTSYPFIYTTLMNVLKVDASEFSRLRAVQLCGLPSSPNGRRKVSEQLGGVSVLDTYGMSEFGAITSTCSHGSMHVVDSDFLVQIINPKTLATVAAGQGGEIVITTLQHQGSPRIKYRTGDIGRIQSESCGCGNAAPVLRVMGRLRDLVEIGSQRVLASDIEDAICEFPWTLGMFHARFVNETEIEITIDVTCEDYEASAEAVKKEILARTGVEMSIRCVAPGQARREVVTPTQTAGSVKSLHAIDGSDKRGDGWLVTY